MSKKCNQLCKDLRVNENELSVLAGGLIGDSTLGARNANGAVRLKVEHSRKQEEYVKWKLAQLPKHLWSRTKGIFYAYDSKKDYETVAFQTNTDTQLVRLFDLFYLPMKDGTYVKTITPELLSHLPINPIFLAVWFCDDGSVRNDAYSGKIATMCYSFEEHVLLQEWLRESFRIETKIVFNSKTKGQHYLSIPAKEFGRFADLIRPTVLQIPSMTYKFNDSRRAKSRFY